MAKRIQRKRTRGWRMPEGAVYVGRPTRWGNPFEVGDERTHEEAVECYEQHLLWMEYKDPAGYKEFIAPLEGKDLACWCAKGQKCHADILIRRADIAAARRQELANATP